MLQSHQEASYLMWAPAGPSWLSEQQPPSLPPAAYIDHTHLSIDYSPPTKWPRAATPVNTRSADSVLLGTSADSGVGLNLSFSSPPIVNRGDQCRMSPGLRTPTSRPGIHMSATPSPYSSFRAVSDRALRLSNTENVLGFRFRGGSIEKPPRTADITPSRVTSGPSGPVNASRCLQMPSTSDNGSPDRTLPMTMGDIFDTHEIDGSMADDSGLFGIDVSLHATSTPLPLSHSPQPFLGTTSVPAVPNPYVDIGNTKLIKTESPPMVVKKSSPPTPSSFKRALRDVQRQGILRPRKLLADNTNTPSPSLQNQQEEYKPQVDNVSETLKRRRENSMSDVFEVPKKPLKPYSRRWMRLVTGGTNCQRELTAAAHAFIARLPQVKDSW